MIYSDAHCHAHEFSTRELEKFSKSFRVIVAVSDDLESSLRTVKLSKDFKIIYPCIGVHPWSLKSEAVLDSTIKSIERLVKENGVQCLGEIGLDKAFMPQTMHIQYTYFTHLLDVAKDYGLAVNLHAAKTWRIVLRETLARGIKRALFHWFTGPLDVLRELVAHGYLVSINPTVKTSKKHLRVALESPLTSMVFESDGPYKYRGIYLNPDLIPETLDYIAEARGLDPRELLEKTNENLERFLEG